MGYPIRNVGEGVIRASLYETSLAPVVDAFKAGFDGAGNLLFRRNKQLSVKQENIVTELSDDINEGLADIKHADLNPYKSSSRDEMLNDPAFVRASRDGKFRSWWKATLSKFSIELKRNEDMVAEAQKHYDEVQARVPQETSLDVASGAIDDINAMATPAPGDARTSVDEMWDAAERVRVKPTKKNPGREVIEGDPVPEGKFTDASGYGIDEATFLPGGQVILHRTGIPRQRRKTAIVVKTAGTLLGGNQEYAFQAGKRFTVTEVNEANGVVVVQISGVKGPVTLPMEVVTSKGAKQEVRALKDVVKRNNEEFTRRERNEGVQATVGGFSTNDLPPIRTPVRDGDIDVELVEEFANARASLEMAQENLDVLRRRLAEMYKPSRAVQMYAQQRVRKNMAYQTEIYQDAGAT